MRRQGQDGDSRRDNGGSETISLVSIGHGDSRRAFYHVIKTKFWRRLRPDQSALSVETETNQIKRS
jgi:hypothetical protein